MALDDHWDSDSMVNLRRRAAASLLAKDPTKDVDDVLDFFELLALLTDRAVIDDEMAWHAYYWPLVNYWRSSQDYIRQTRELEGETTWQDLERLAVRLQAVEERKRPRRKGPPSQEQTELYLRDETELPSA